MNISKKPLIACLGVFKSTGGTTATVSKFQSALGAPVYSFTSKKFLRNNQFGLSGLSPVWSSSLPFLSQIGFSFPSALNDFKRAVSQASIVSCHSYFRLHNYYVYKECQRHKVPYWSVPHGILDPYVWTKSSSVKNLFHKLYGKQYLDSASCIIFASKGEQLKAESMVGPLHSEVIHWPVLIPDLSLAEEMRSGFRKRRGILPECRVYLYLGRLTPMKRPLETLAAFAKSDTANAVLLYVGPDEEITATDILNEASRLGVSRRVHVLGPLYGVEKQAAIFASDLYISLSIRENFNNSAMECSASGVPVFLSSGNDMHPELCDAGAGWNVKGDSFKCFVEAFLQASSLTSDEIRQAGHCARLFAQNHLSFDHFNSLLNRLIFKYARKD